MTLSEKISFMNEWDIKDKGNKNVHPSHKTAVIEAKDVKEFIKELKEELQKEWEQSHFVHPNIVDKLAGGNL